MRICYLINGLNGGGAAFPMIDVIQVMRSRGHDVSVMAFMKQDGRASARLLDANIPFEIIGRGYWDFVSAGLTLSRRLREIQPDLLWTSLTRATIFGQAFGRLLGIPVVSWQHSAYLKPGNLAILRRTRRWTRRWVADSAAVKQFLQARLDVPDGDVDIWPLFAAKSTTPLARKWDGIAPFRIGTLGRLHPNKRFDVIVHAAARVKELDPATSSRLAFFIAGDGPELTKLQALAAKLKVGNIFFPGFQSKPTEFLATLQAYLQPSRKEGLCLAAHEAMQAALPVIASPVGEISNSVLNGETGWLCDIGDVDGFARAILKLAKDPARAAHMGIAGRARLLSRFAPGSLVNAGHQILERIELEMHPRGADA